MSDAQEQQVESTTQWTTTTGNPVFSCMLSPVFKGELPTQWAKSKQHPLYRTTSSEYGRRPPTNETLPCTFHPKSQRFTKEEAKFGQYRNSSFNTALDRSRVYDCPNLQHTV